MRVLIAEHDHAVYAQLLSQQAPELQVLTSGDSAELANLAADCPVWLGQPDLLANLLRQGHAPQWMQSTWAGITPLLADGLSRHYRLTRAVGIFGQVMAEYVLTYMLGHEREVMARLVSQVERKWDGRLGRSLEGRRVLSVGTGDIGQQGRQGCRNCTCALQGACPHQLFNGFSHITQPATHGEQQQTAHNNWLSAQFVGSPTQRDLHASLCKAVNSHGQAHQTQVVPTGHTGGMKRKYGQDHEHAKHAQRVNAG